MILYEREEEEGKEKRERERLHFMLLLVVIKIYHPLRQIYVALTLSIQLIHII